MDGRSLTSLQMTISLIILSQIITLTHMLPVESRYRRLDLDLLLDPVHQEMQSDDLEDKRVVPKSVYHTQLRLTTESPCNSGSQRAKEGGPCLRINSSQGSLLDEKFLSSVLKDIHITRQGGRRKPNRNRNRSTTTTTEVPVVQSTLQQDQDGVEEDDTLLMELITSTTLPPSTLDEIVQTYELPGVFSTFSPVQNSAESHRGSEIASTGITDGENEDGLIPKTSTVRSTKPHESQDRHTDKQQMSFIATTEIPQVTTIPQEVSTKQEVVATTQNPIGTTEGQTEIPDVFQVIPEFINANKNSFSNQSPTKSSTTLKPDSFILSFGKTDDGLVTKITTGPKEKTVNLTTEVRENVTATDVRVINFSPTPTTVSSATSSSTNNFPLNTVPTEDTTDENTRKGANDVDAEEDIGFSTQMPQVESESFTAVTEVTMPAERTNRPPIVMSSIMEPNLAKRGESLSQNEPEVSNDKDTRTNGAAGAPISPSLAVENSTRIFNYSDALMTEPTTQLPMSHSMEPDVRNFEILVESTILPLPEDSSELPTSPSSSHDSKIDQNIAVTDSRPGASRVEGGSRRVTAKVDEEPSFAQPNNVFFPLDEDEIPPSTTMRNDQVPSRIRFEDEETTTFETTPRELTITRKRILIPFEPQPAPHIEESRREVQQNFEGFEFPLQRPATQISPQRSQAEIEILNQKIRDHEMQRQQQQFQGREFSERRVTASPTLSHLLPISSQQSHEDDIDKLHHKSRTRNRMRNPDLEDVPPTRVLNFPDDFFRHQQQSVVSRDLQNNNKQQVPSKPIVGAYPQFISLDYLRLGDNYRRFRVF